MNCTKKYSKVIITSTYSEEVYVVHLNFERFYSFSHQEGEEVSCDQTESKKFVVSWNIYFLSFYNECLEAAETNMVM